MSLVQEISASLVVLVPRDVNVGGTKIQLPCSFQAMFREGESLVVLEIQLSPG